MNLKTSVLLLLTITLLGCLFSFLGSKTLLDFSAQATTRHSSKGHIQQPTISQSQRVDEAINSFDVKANNDFQDDNIHTQKPTSTLILKPDLQILLKNKITSFESKLEDLGFPQSVENKLLTPEQEHQVITLLTELEKTKTQLFKIKLQSWKGLNQ